MSTTNTKWYPTQVAPTPKKARKTARPAKLRASLVPGAVLIVLAGRYRGKRVVLLKSFDDATLLVSGPFKINGVPLRRVNARYVIATSTKVDISNVSGLDKFTPAYFARERKTEKKVTEEELFGDAPAPKKEVSEQRVADQKSVDSALTESIKKTPLLKEYLGTPFSLKNGDKPHLLKF